MMYYVAFDLSVSSGLGSLTLTRAASSDIAVTLGSVTGTRVDATTTSSIFFHAVGSDAAQRVTGQDPSSTIKLLHYSRAPYAQSLQTALRAAATAAGWANPNNITVTHATTTGIYTIAASGYTIGYTFSTAAGGALLSFTDLSEAAASSHTGTIVPTYAISATLPSVSLDTPNYEPRGIANHVETDNGTGGGMSRSVSPQYRRFRQEYETKEKTRRAFAASTHPYTFEHMRTDCRGQYAFMIIDGFGAATNEVFSFRTDSTHFEPMRASEGNDAQYHIDFDCVVEGTMASYSP